MIEMERTYLVKDLPQNIETYPHKELIDHYLPIDSHHAKLRLRKRGDMLEITKKTLVNEWDCSIQKEETIILSPEEYEALAQLPCKKVHKIRYYVPYQDYIVEFDVFQWDLEWLILADIEFPDEQSQKEFLMPDFCLAEVTQEEWVAWGMLCGKSYKEILSYIKQI